MQVTLRSANDSDLDFLLELRLQTMDQHYVAQGKNLSREEHLERVLRRFDCAKVVLVDGRPAGLLKLARNGIVWHLFQIQLLPDLQGRGMGTQLLSEVISQARDAGASIRLGVLKTNPARNLYERLGFVQVAETSDSIEMELSPDHPTGSEHAQPN